MADNTPAKNHLSQVESSLSDITQPDSINSIIGKTSLNLSSSLSSKNLFIDNDLLASLEIIRNRLNNLGTEAVNRESYLNTQIAGLGPDAGYAAARANLMSEQNKIHNITSTTHRNDRHNEYANLFNYANDFNLSSSLGDLDINTVSVATSGCHTLNLSTTFMKPASAHTPDRYVLCDESGNEITPTSTTAGMNTYKLNIGEDEYTLGGIQFTAGTLNCSALTISPALRDSPQEITLSINSVFDASSVNVRDVNVVCNKKFKLKLNNGSVTLDTVHLRGAEFDRYNSPPGMPGAQRILDIVETNFNSNRYKREREAIAKALEGTQYATLNDKQKEEFYQRIRGDDGDYFNSILASEVINTDIDRFHGFRDRFIESGRDWNKGDNIKSNDNYIKFITNNVSGKVGGFILSKLDHYLGNTDEKAFLHSELTSYLNEIEENKLDNDPNICNNINTAVEAEGHQIDRKHHWYQLSRRKDAHYMRFFSGSTTSLKGEVVDIHTNTGPEDVGNIEPMKYDMDVKISGKNSIEVEIKIEGEKKPIRIKSGEPAALVRKIMRDGRINHGKARAHIGFNVYKAMTKMAKEKDISLQYRDGNNTRYIDINDGNIVVREVSNLVSLGRRNERIIFDQQKFINSNNFDIRADNSSLRTGIDELGKHFTFAMNRLHDQYRHGIERKFGTLFNSRNKMRLPVYLWSSWLSPIKKLVNLRDTTNFDFNTTITSKGKNVSVNLKGNKFTVNMEGYKPIVSKDLGKILNKRQKRVRIFDGMERDIVEGVYAALIGKLRENSKIANTDFGVMDNTTGNMFVLDRDGRFGTIDRQNLETEGNPLRYGECGRLNHERLDANTVDWFDHGSAEEKELMKNPFLMQRLVKAMNRRLARR